MSHSDETRWSMVQGAAGGDRALRDAFACAYLPVIRAYLGARWKGGPHFARLDDAVQDVFIDCFREGGALERVDPERRVRFRTFLYGVVRNVALRHEERAYRGRERQSPSGYMDRVPADDERLSRVFDRAWAQAVMRRAMDRQAAAAAEKGARAQRRVELLRLRFGEGRPIRDIAREWEQDAAVVHREYRTAREEFKQALHNEVAADNPGTPGDVERECAQLLALLGAGG